jgi:hypothetical protein
LEPFLGTPDLLGAPTKPNNAAALYIPRGGVVEPGFWLAAPTEIGPFPPGGGSASAEATFAMFATTKPFDPAVLSPTGDLWFQSFNPAYTFSPVDLQPGESVTVNVVITPSGPPGTIVSGNLYVDGFVSSLARRTNLGTPAPTADEIAAFPYAYTIK